MNLLQWLMKGLGMTKKKSISPSNKEKDRRSDCQSIEEPKSLRFNWRKVVLLEPTSGLIVLLRLALLYGGFYYYHHYTVNKDNIYSLSMLFSLIITFIKTVSMVFGNLKAISLPYPTKEVTSQVSASGILFKTEMSSSKMHELMRLNTLMTVPSTLKFMLRHTCFQTSPRRTAITIWICIFAKTIIWPMMANPTNGLMMKTRTLPGKTVQNPLMVNERPCLIDWNLISYLECWEVCLYMSFSLNGGSEETIKTSKTTPASS